MAIWHVARLRFAPAFRALGVCEHIWPFSLRDIWATLLSPKWAEIFVAQMAGDETSLPRFATMDVENAKGSLNSRRSIRSNFLGFSGTVEENTVTLL